MTRAILNSTLAGVGVILIGVSASAQGNRPDPQRRETARPIRVAQAAQAPDAPLAQQLHMMDQRFLMATALGDMMEIDLSQLAETRASSDAVKALAQRLRQDHQTNLSVLRTLANSKGMMLPAEMLPNAGAANGNAASPDEEGLQAQEANPAEPDNVAEPASGTVPGEVERLALRHLVVKHQDMRDLLSDMSGTEFDEAWLGAQVKHHAMAVADFELHARHGRDEEVRGYAARTLPILQEHFRMTRELAGLPPTAMAGRAGEAPIGTRTGSQRAQPTSQVAGYREGSRVGGTRATRRRLAR